MPLSPRQEALLQSAPARALFRGLRWAHRRQLLVLTYHSVVDVPPADRRRHPWLYRNAVTVDRFARQMRFLKARYHVAGPADLRAFLDGVTLPGPSVLLTFDDGLLNNYTVAWPVLRRLALPAFFFLPTAFVDDASAGRLRWHWSEALAAALLDADPPKARQALAQVLPEAAPPRSKAGGIRPEAAVGRLKAMSSAERRGRLARLRAALPAPDPDAFPADRHGHSLVATMTWKQARQMAGEGAAFGAHTVHHALLSRLPDAEARREIRQSVARVEAQTGACHAFAYPNGTAADFASTHERTLARLGCAAFTQVRGFNRPAPACPQALRRIDTSPDHGLGAFRYVTSGAKHLSDAWLRPDRAR